MPRFFGSFLFKLVLTVIMSIFIGYQIAKIEFGQAEYSFRKILGTQATSNQELEGRIKEFLRDKEGEYAILVKDLKPEGKRNVYINSSLPLPSASLYKLYLMAAAYEQVNAGSLSLDTEISAKLSHLDAVIGGREFGYEDFSSSEVIGYTVKEAMERIAAFSDNYAAIILAEKVGWSKVQTLAESIGTKNTTIKDPITTSADDIGLLLEKLYKGEVVTIEASEQIIDMLSKSQMNNRIPALLPKEVKVAHKTGELARIRHDAGIVFLQGNPYVLVLMSRNLKGEDEGVENLAQISKIVYDYYAANSAEKE